MSNFPLKMLGKEAEFDGFLQNQPSDCFVDSLFSTSTFLTPQQQVAGIVDTHLRCYDFTIKTFLHTVFRGFDCWLNCNCVELLHLNLDVVFRQNAIDIYFVAALEPISHSNLHNISHNGFKSRVKEDTFQQSDEKCSCY